MNAIIVGPNGRPSILDMLLEYNFKNHIYVFTYRTMKNGDRKWYTYNSKDLEDVREIKGSPSFNSGSKVIFWGTRVNVNTGKAIVYNPPRNLNNASNKGLARALFAEAEIPAPLLIDYEEVENARFPLIIRRNHHSGGMYFYVVDSKEALDAVINKRIKGDDYYISEIYPKTAEYRVHCASGKALLVKQKPTPDDKSTVAWNFHINEKPWTTINRKDYDVDMIKMALDAVRVLDLDFGAVDIMSKPSKKGFSPHVVLEVNTAPSYTPYLISKYGAYFDMLFSMKSKAEHWDYSVFKKGPSLSWKNEQLEKGIIKSKK